MKILINDTEVEIFSGARVRNVLMKYSQKGFRQVKQGKKEVTDKRKNPLDLDDELSDAQQLYIVEVN